MNLSVVFKEICSRSDKSLLSRHNSISGTGFVMLPPVAGCGRAVQRRMNSGADGLVTCCVIGLVTCCPHYRMARMLTSGATNPEPCTLMLTSGASKDMHRPALAHTFSHYPSLAYTHPPSRTLSLLGTHSPSRSHSLPCNEQEMKREFKFVGSNVDVKMVAEHKRLEGLASERSNPAAIPQVPSRLTRPTVGPYALPVGSYVLP